MKTFWKNNRQELFVLLVFAVVSVLLVLFPISAKSATHLHSEATYQQVWCDKAGGVTEYTLDDGTRGSRVDCLTDTHAIEFDFINKWPEALSQARYYAKMTNKKPGIVFIIEKPENIYTYTYILRLLNTLPSDNSDIQFWFMFPEEVPQ